MKNKLLYLASKRRCFGNHLDASFIENVANFSEGKKRSEVIEAVKAHYQEGDSEAAIFTRLLIIDILSELATVTLCSDADGSLFIGWPSDNSTTQRTEGSYFSAKEAASHCAIIFPQYPEFSLLSTWEPHFS